MFSPILAMVSAMSSATVMLPALAALIFSTSAPTIERHVGDHLDEALEQIVARDEIGLGVDLDHDALGALDRDADQPFGGDAAGLLGGLRQALLAQPIDCAASMSPEVSPSAALQSIMPAPVDLAQFLDHLCGDICHRS